MSATTTIPIRQRPPRPARRPVPPRVPRVPVLVTLAADGYVEIFGDGIDVRVEVLLDGKGVPEAEATAEAYLEASLPPKFRALHFLPKLAASGMCESRSPEDELSRIRELRILRGLRDIREAKTRQAQRARAARLRPPVQAKPTRREPVGVIRV